ncbi:MAG: ester cyclase [Myxococcota bacterium]|nr:ester cyclase [Myxococcota bacterium]
MSNQCEAFSMDRHDIEKLVQRWTQEAVAGGRLDVFDDLLATDVVDRSGPTPSQGVEPFKARAAAVRAAFADIDIRVDNLLVDGDAIAWRWTLAATHVGPFAGLASTGRRTTLRGVNFQRLQGDRVVEHWTLVDVFGAMQALRS